MDQYGLGRQITWFHGGKTHASCQGFASIEVPLACALIVGLAVTEGAVGVLFGHVVRRFEEKKYGLLFAKRMILTCFNRSSARHTGRRGFGTEVPLARSYILQEWSRPLQRRPSSALRLEPPSFPISEVPDGQC